MVHSEKIQFQGLKIQLKYSKFYAKLRQKLELTVQLPTPNLMMSVSRTVNNSNWTIEGYEQIVLVNLRLTD